MAKVYLYNPEDGAPIKNWWDGSDRWNLDVGEVKAFPERAAELLTDVYAFLQKVSLEEYEEKIAKLENEETPKIKVGAEGGFVPKSSQELDQDEASKEKKKAKLKKEKDKVVAAKDAEPENPNLWELSRGDLINECTRKGIEIKGLGKKGVRVTKEQIINLLENA